MASGDSLFYWNGRSAEFPAANAPGGGTVTLRNRQPKLDFDPTTDETCYFHGILPSYYGGGGVTVKLHWTSSATSGAARWECAVERATAQDIDSDSFATAASAGTTTSATSGIPVITSLGFANGTAMDSLAAGEKFRLLVRRDADGTTGTDDLAADAELLDVYLQET